MSTWLIDRKIRCPYCNAPMTIVLDLSAGGQAYIEDCQVCCQPIQIGFVVADDELVDLQVDAGG